MDKRLFIAIKIEPAEILQSKLNYLKNNLSHENINWIQFDHYHQTLAFLGSTPESKIESVVGAMSSSFQNVHEFNIELGDLGIFGSHYNPKVIWLSMSPEEKLKSLHFSLRKELENIGFQFDRQNFVPHLTLARIRKIEDKKHFHEVINGWDSGFVQNQKVSEIILFESILSPRGASYAIVSKVRLS